MANLFFNINMDNILILTFYQDFIVNYHKSVQ
jgi:hypothetical protein